MKAAQWKPWQLPSAAYCERWQASYAGDEWTEAMLFNPPMRLRQLLADLRGLRAHCGLPIVVNPNQGRAALCPTR